VLRQATDDHADLAGELPTPDAMGHRPDLADQLLPTAPLRSGRASHRPRSATSRGPTDTQGRKPVTLSGNGTTRILAADAFS